MMTDRTQFERATAQRGIPTQVIAIIWESRQTVPNQAAIPEKLMDMNICHQNFNAKYWDNSLLLLVPHPIEQPAGRLGGGGLGQKARAIRRTNVWGNPRWRRNIISTQIVGKTVTLASTRTATAWRRGGWTEQTQPPRNNVTMKVHQLPHHHLYLIWRIVPQRPRTS
jgi:hypothetical protein